MTSQQELHDLAKTLCVDAKHISDKILFYNKTLSNFQGFLLNIYETHLPKIEELFLKLPNEIDVDNIELLKLEKIDHTVTNYRELFHGYEHMKFAKIEELHLIGQRLWLLCKVENISLSTENLSLFQEIDTYLSAGFKKMFC